MIVVVFNKEGYDPFIDFLKGISIILVLITHSITQSLEHATLFEIWGRIAVPIFLLIQVLHFFLNPQRSKLSKIWTRVLKPYLYVQILIFFILMLFDHSKTLVSYVDYLLLKGGYGPGEYYPWIYIQFAFLLPLWRYVFNKFNGGWSLLLLIFISQILEILCVFFNIPDWPYYSILFFRYTFLFYLGYLLAKGECNINTLTILLSIISIVVTFLFCYCPLVFRPFFVVETQWFYCHWPCYIYIFYIGIGGCYLIWHFLETKKELKLLEVVIRKLGRYSYEIFLFQMFYFLFLYEYLQNMISFTNNSLILYLLYIPISVIFCTIPIVIYKEKISHIWPEKWGMKKEKQAF